MAKEVTRYDLVTNYRAGSSIEEMERADDGEWIRYEDLHAQLTSLTEAVARVEQEKEKLRLNWAPVADLLSGNANPLLDEPVDYLRELLGRLQKAEEAVAQLRQQQAEAEQQLAYWWYETGRCPCGARREAPVTHPHVPGCPTEAALSITFPDPAPRQE